MSIRDFTTRISDAGGSLVLDFVALQPDFMRWEGSSTTHLGDNVLLPAFSEHDFPDEDSQLRVLRGDIARDPEHYAKFDRWNLIRFHFTTVLTHERSATP